MSKKFIIIMISLLFIITACTNKPKTDWTPEEKEEIFSVIESYKDAVNEKSYEQVMTIVDTKSPMYQFLQSEQYKTSFESTDLQKELVSIDIYPIEKKYVKTLEDELNTTIDRIVTVITVEEIKTAKRIKQVSGGYVLILKDDGWKIWSVESLAVDKDTSSIQEGVSILKAAEIAYAQSQEVPTEGYKHQDLKQYLGQISNVQYAVTYSKEEDTFYLSNHPAAEVVTGNMNEKVTFEQMNEFR